MKNEVWWVRRHFFVCLGSLRAMAVQGNVIGQGAKHHDIDLEDFSADNFTRILQWMGEPSPAAGGCAYTDVLAANSGGGLQNAEPGHSVLDAKACKLT